MRSYFSVNSFPRSENEAGLGNSRYNITCIFESENQPKAQYFGGSGSSLIDREHEGATNIIGHAIELWEVKNVTR